MFPYPVTPKSMLYNLQSSFTINNIDSVVVVVVVGGGGGGRGYGIWTEWK